MEPNDQSDLERQIRAHLSVVLLLAALVGLNVGVSFLPVAGGLRVGAHVGLAVLSGALVLTFFMHLWSEKRLTLAVLALTFLLLAAMMILTWVARHDHPAMTEYHPAVPPAAPHHVP